VNACHVRSATLTTGQGQQAGRDATAGNGFQAGGRSTRPSVAPGGGRSADKPASRVWDAGVGQQTPECGLQGFVVKGESAGQRSPRGLPSWAPPHCQRHRIVTRLNRSRTCSRARQGLHASEESSKGPSRAVQCSRFSCFPRERDELQGVQGCRESRVQSSCT